MAQLDHLPVSNIYEERKLGENAILRKDEKIAQDNQSIDELKGLITGLPDVIMEKIKNLLEEKHLQKP